MLKSSVLGGSSMSHKSHTISAIIWANDNGLFIYLVLNARHYFYRSYLHCMTKDVPVTLLNNYLFIWMYWLSFCQILCVCDAWAGITQTFFFCLKNVLKRSFSRSSTPLHLGTSRLGVSLFDRFDNKGRRFICFPFLNITEKMGTFKGFFPPSACGWWDVKNKNTKFPKLMMFWDQTVLFFYC